MRKTLVRSIHDEVLLMADRCLLDGLSNEWHDGRQTWTGRRVERLCESAFEAVRKALEKWAAKEESRG